MTIKENQGTANASPSTCPNPRDCILRFEELDKAFLNNDLGGKDYDGHRLDHLKRKKEQDLIEGYKNDLTGRVLYVLLGGVCFLIGAGVMAWVKDLIKTVGR